MSILGIDIGTTGTKAIVFNEDGNILSSSYSEYGLIFPKPNYVEFDVDIMWRNIFDAIRRVNSNEKVKKDPIDALSASTVSESFTPVGYDGNTLSNTIFSTDARSIKELEYIFTKISLKDLYGINGYPPGYISPLNKILWLKTNLPAIYSKTKKILFTEDLLFHKLGITDTKINYSLCCRTLFFDIKNKKWSDKILDEFGIDKSLFSEPSSSGVEIGYVSRSIAEDLGFKKKVSIATGGHDQPCAALGVGAITEGVAVDGMGTAECITTTLKKLMINDKLLRNNFSTQIHVVDNMYATLAFNATAGSVINWYIDEFFSEEKKSAKEKGKSIFKHLFSKFTYEPSGLYVLPYFAASGTPYFDPNPRGTIMGLNLSTKKEEILKAIIEGLVFEIVFNIELMKNSGINIKELRAVGGGSNSDYWLNLKSSILGMPIKRLYIKEAGCLAAMILAGKATKKFNIKEAISNFIRVEREFYPNKKIGQKYIDRFNGYKKIYNLISKVYYK